MTTTVLAAIEAFFVARAPRKESPHTLAAYRRDLLEVARLAAAAAGSELGGLSVEQLTGSLLRVAFAEFAGPRSAASVARAWSTWNQFFTFLVAEGTVAGNPMPAVQRPKLPRRTPKPLQGEDTPERLLAAVLAGARKARDPWPERDLVALALGLLAGLRLSEMLGLTVGSLAGRPGERRLQVLGKGGKTRSVPIEPALERLIDVYLRTRLARFGQRTLPRDAPLLVNNRGEALRRGGLQYLVRQCYRHAGIHDRVPKGALVHALRHTFATRLAEDGATASEIMALLGHASITTSQNYIDATAREQREAVRANRTYRTLERLLDST
ncbi:integrase [Carbonactinospora thermoautotrophica]|uniref:Integrase n=1 Tax=Carbonactinospora thermoautotrophica TaxID=1469144 RepID=A0A132NHX5_9ACTN|nr:tyrosine-type recombinase/integrase [Carbonactinospora thermoautotrophica]KWX04826.1 integrase [Carbonactinospora thermoautotrophica]KWX09694.1 integrase [Carbonactinospora thermoautotrophica]MCX9193330.1 integrase [Carbonactinospora thermoautotrophica]